MTERNKQSGARGAGEYVEVLNPEGYFSNAEITNLRSHVLVKGSQNCRIINKEKVAVSKRYTLKGAAKWINSRIQTSFDWKTNTNVYRNTRGYQGENGGELEVWFEGTWERIKNGLPKIRFNWATWWSADELLDLQLGVCGDGKIYMWSGGIAEVAAVTSNTISKKGYFSGNTIAFDASDKTITDTSKSLLDRGFASGDRITISGSASNDGEYIIDTIERDDLDTMDVVTLVASNVLVDEAAGAAVVFRWTRNGTWAEARFLATTASRSVTINGTVYEYTGGEDTGTLTGVTPDPTGDVAPDDRVMQTVMESEPTEFETFLADLIGVSNNHVYYGCTTSREVLISKNTDYEDFTATTPVRVPGEGYRLTLDSATTAIVPDEDDMYLSGGDDDWYKVRMEFTSDQAGESVIIKKLKTAQGQAALNQGVVAYVKNAVAFLSVERVIDTLGRIENVEGPQNKSISDDIKDDLEAYDITDAHALYYRRSLFICLPAEGVVLEYDMRFGYWQPPQLWPVSRLAIIDDQLCGHSSTSNETYRLFDGYDDNGAPFLARMAFGYDNFGYRFSLKQFDEAGVEMYISQNTIVRDYILYEYLGAEEIREFEIDGSDESILFTPAINVGLGQNPLGSQPLGSNSGELADMSKARVIHTTTVKDFFERQRIFESDSPGARFEVIAYGENTRLSENEPTFIRK